MIEAFDAASGASEEYFKKLEKYRSTVKSMNLAFKEGSGHMREYLQQAEKSGGTMAVIAAATTYLLKGVTDLASKYKDSVLEVKRYNIEQEQFQRSSLKSSKDIGYLRGSLELTRKEMTNFFGVMSQSEGLGIGVEQLEETFVALKNIYGTQAMGMIKEYQNILEKMPDLNLRINTTGDSKLTGDEWYEILKSGNVKKVIELRGAGLFGGNKKTSENARYETHQEKIEYYLEEAKDLALDNLPIQTLYLSQIGESSAKALEALTTISGTVGGIKEMFVMRGLTGLASNGTLLNQARPVLSGFGGQAGTTLAGSTMTAGVAASVGGLAVAAGAAALALAELKLRADQGYTPSWKERKEAVLTNPGSFLAKAGSDSLKYMSLGSVDLEKWGAFNRPETEVDKSKPKPQHVKKYTKEYAYKILKGDKQLVAAGDIYTQIKLGMDRFDELQGDTIKISQSMMEIANVTGEGKKYFENLNKYSTALGKRWKEDQKLINEGLEKARVQKEAGIKEKGDAFLKTDAGILLNQTIRAAELELVEKQKVYNDAMLNTLENLTFIANQGAKDYPNKLRLQLQSERAGSAVEISKRSGGEFGALQSQKAKDIKTAKDELIGIERAIAQGKKDKEDTSDKILKVKITEKLIGLEKQRTQAIKTLNETLSQNKELDFLISRLGSLKEVLTSSEKYISDISGSFSDLNPLWQQSLEFSKQEAALKEKDFRKFAEQKGVDKQGSEYKQKEKESNLAQIKYAQDIFDYAKASRDKKLEEINLQADWQKEQASFYEEMGGHFSDVISMRVKGIEKERESISAMENFLATSGISGHAREAQIIELEKKKMSLTRQTIGIQKDAYDKFVGMAYGAISDIGAKRGRMDASVLMGRGATRTRNKEGMYTGGGVGMNRDQMSALNSTGFFNKDPSELGGFEKTALVPGEERARRATAMRSSEAQRVEVKTQVIVEPSPEFQVKIQEMIKNVASDQAFLGEMAKKFISKDNNVAGASR